MKSVWIAIVIFGMLSAGCCGGAYYMMKGFTGTLTEARSGALQFSAKATQDIGMDWNPDTIWAYASPEFSKSYTRDDVAKLAERLSRGLGPVRVVGPFTISKRRMVPDSYGGNSLAFDTWAGATFEKGQARVEIQAVRRNNVWKLMDFKVLPALR